MRMRSFTVPFSEVMGDAHELDFGPDDHMVVRPLFSMSREASSALADRMAEVGEMADKATGLSRNDTIRAKAEAAADQLVADVVGLAVLEWHLAGEDGEPVPKPDTPEKLNLLPAGLASALYPFLTAFRGRDPNPTTRS